MANEKISEIFDVEAIVKQKNDVEKSIQSIINKMGVMTNEIQGFYERIGQCQGILELTKAIKDSSKEYKKQASTISEFNKLMQEKDRLDIKLTESLKGQYKAVEKIRQEVSEHTKAIKESVRVEREMEKAKKASTQSITEVIAGLKRQRDSVSELNLENKRLRDLVKSMDYNTQKVEIEQINTVINANTALVELNSDAYVKQKMNIGNYKSAVDGLDSIMNSLGAEMKRVADAGGENSEEFRRLNAEFQKAQAKSAEFSEKIGSLDTNTVSLRGQMRELVEQMVAMERAGLRGTDAYADLSAKAGELKDAIGDVNQQIENMASDTSTFDAVLNAATGLTGGFEAFQGVMGLCNIESEEFEKIQAKVQSAIAITNGLQAVANTLNKDSALMVKLDALSHSKSVVAKKAATVAQMALNGAIWASPVTWLVLGIAALVGGIGYWLSSTKELTEEQKRQNEVTNKAVDGYAKEKTEIEGIAGRIKEGNASRLDQTRMVEILTEKYGENYAKGKSMQEMEQDFVKNADAFVEAAIKRAEAQAAFELAVEAQKKALESATKGVEEYVGWWGRLFRTEEAEARIAEKRRRKEIKDLESQSQKYLKIQAEKQQGEQAAMKKSGELTDAEKKAEIERTKNFEIQIKKREELRERDHKASFDADMLKVQQQAAVYKAIYDDEKNSYNVRLSALTCYEDEQIKLIKKQNKEQLLDAEKTAEERKFIKQKEAADILSIKTTNNAELAKLEAQDTAKQMAKLDAYKNDQIMNLEKNQSMELLILSRKHANGEMSEEEYGKNKLAVSIKYNKLIFDLEMQTLANIANSMTGDDRVKAFQEIKRKQLEFSKYCDEQEIDSNDKKAIDEEERDKMLKNARIQLAQEAFDGISDIASSMFDRKIQEVDAEIEKIDEQKEAQLTAVDEMDISDEERASRKQEIENRAEAEKDKLEKKKKKLQTEQAKADKAAALIRVAINTAVGVTAAWSDPLTAPVLVPFIIASGVIQAAIIAAQPIPKYAKGTGDHPGGYAVVGDGGKQELALFPTGEYYVTPSIPTLVDLPKHTEILPDFSRMLTSMTFSQTVSDAPVYDFSRLEQQINELGEIIKHNRPQMNINLDKNGVWTTYDHDKGKTTYLNKRFLCEM
ncbi:MAG: hypothetical protein RR137_08960 [Odoribacter sp.]